MRWIVVDQWFPKRVPLYLRVVRDMLKYQEIIIFYYFIKMGKQHFPMYLIQQHIDMRHRFR